MNLFEEGNEMARIETDGKKINVLCGDGEISVLPFNFGKSTGNVFHIYFDPKNFRIFNTFNSGECEILCDSGHIQIVQIKE